jgi:hypothetical protein
MRKNQEVKKGNQHLKRKFNMTQATKQKQPNRAIFQKQGGLLC